MTITELSEILRSYWGLWLMILFLGIVAWTFWPRNKERLERHGDIPLRDEDEER